MSLRLSPIDPLFTGPNAYEITLALDYAGPLDEERLRAGFEAALEAYWPLRGELVEEGGFLAFRDARRAELSFGEGDVEPVETLPGRPLCRARAGRTRLSLSVSHAAADGYSVFQFLAAWAAGGKPARAPELDRSPLIPDESPLPPAPATAKDLRRACGWAGAGIRRAPAKRPRRRLRFSEAELARLAAEAGLELGMGLSANDLLCAHLWKTVFPERVELSIPLDFRRLHPDLGPAFFGNAVVGVPVDLEPGETASSVPLKTLALRVRDAVRGRRLPEVERALEALEALRRESGVAALQAMPVCDPDRGILVTNLSRVPSRALDFGAGAPVGLEFKTAFDGSAVILPAEDGLEVQL